MLLLNHNQFGLSGDIQIRIFSLYAKGEFLTEYKLDNKFSVKTNFINYAFLNKIIKLYINLPNGKRIIKTEAEMEPDFKFIIVT